MDDPRCEAQHGQQHRRAEQQCDLGLFVDKAGGGGRVADRGRQARVIVGCHRAKDKAEIGHPDRPGGLELAQSSGPKSRWTRVRAARWPSVVTSPLSMKAKPSVTIARHRATSRADGSRGPQGAKARNIKMPEHERDNRRDQDHGDQALRAPEPQCQHAEGGPDDPGTHVDPRQIADPAQAGQQRALRPGGNGQRHAQRQPGHICGASLVRQDHPRDPAARQPEQARPDQGKKHGPPEQGPAGAAHRLVAALGMGSGDLAGADIADPERGD